jgi:hypothetical protein
MALRKQECPMLLETNLIAETTGAVETIAEARRAIVLDESLRAKLRRSAVYHFLVRECLNFYVGTLRDIEQHWGLDRADVDRLGIASPPTWVTNLIGANACAEKFGGLADVPGFYCCGGLWWLDIDEGLARRGLILPVRDPKRPSLITNLQVFRHVRDPRPFLLRVRTERGAA